MPGIILTYSKKSNDTDAYNICSSDVSSRMYNRKEFHCETISRDNNVCLKFLFKNKDYKGISESEVGFVAIS